ncbi:MAG TPA: Zn-ribbon domain-containing OB-fold protein [Acidimicrobiales bacterium]|nr:Zn-ribbon domain-containing OB-fold protein [Acidimicrobiales bacterium]
MPKTRIPAVGSEGWFTEDGEGPALLGTRCTTCGTVFFPKAGFFCRNPDCDGSDFEEVRLSRRGTVWSYTDARYQPPPPFVSASDPYQPFAIAAVQLADENMVVLGQVASGFGLDDLRVGAEVELVVEPLFEDDESVQVIWKWKPTDGGRR